MVEKQNDETRETMRKILMCSKAIVLEKLKDLDTSLITPKGFRSGVL